MKIGMSKTVKGMLYGALLMLCLCGGYKAYNDYQINNPTHISANSSLYQEVRRNDLHYLHKIGNREAELVNAQAKRIKYKSSIGMTDNGATMPYHGKYPIYHHDKHGNYWSWFENHQAIMNDNFDFGRTSNQTSGGGGLISSSSSTRSGIIANEKVLKNHGVHSGVNFTYYSM